MRRWTSLAVLAVAAFPAAAAADVTTKEVTLTSGKDEIKAFLAVPEGKGPFPGVVVIQEWWGLTDWIKDQAKHLAKQGYVALAPDLYHGKVATDRTKAQELMKGMPQDRALRDLKAATDYLAKAENVDKSKLGVIGWCMGGGLALQASLKDDRLIACAMCYGRVVTDEKALKPLKAEVLGVFGTKDQGIKIADVRKFADAAKEAGKKVEIKEYEAGHGFMREGKDNSAYDEKSAKAAWEEIDKFFAAKLKGK
jgi:carboxymethylenebutenolidase